MSMGYGQLCELLDELHRRGLKASVMNGRLRFTNPSLLTEDDRAWIAPNVAKIIELVPPIPWTVKTPLNSTESLSL